MDSQELERNWIPHLREQFERGRPILFTGAGFSRAAKNIRREPVPSYDELKQHLWGLCFPQTAFEKEPSLQDLYEHALMRHKGDLSDLLTSLLTVDTDSLPDWYGEVLSMPWQRSYTLNIDDLAAASCRKFKLPRNPVSISATDPHMTVSSNAYRDLEVVHLNGTLQDVPDRITFSTTQYAERLARPDPWYLRFSADLLTSPIVFIGTSLDEPPLWQHLALRHGYGGREMNELRQRSYLVTPTLDRAKQSLLAQFNIVWLPITAEQFVSQVLDQMKSSAAAGQRFLACHAVPAAQVGTNLPEVAELAQNPRERTEFLMGHEPIWADLQSDRAIRRESDEAVWKTIREIQGKEHVKGILLITGTAGSGKSTSLMRAALRLVAEGTRVGWVDRNIELSPGQIRTTMRKEDAPPVLAIDDADLYGAHLAPTVRDIALREPYPLVLVAVRAGKADRALNPVILKDVPLAEMSMPPLGDNDIGGLIDVLEREKRLGVLTAKPRYVQVAAFRDQAGRQLLVGMIQATSGRMFEEKAFEELYELQGVAKLVYAIIAVASAFRFGLTKDEILIACGEQSNAALNALEQLSRRHIVVTNRDNHVWARHRVIAGIIRDELQKRGQLTSPLSGLTLLAATKVRETLHRSARPWRMLRVFANHDFLMRAGALEFARNLYGSLENLLAWDYHFWLQRGSLEVEFGDLALAEHFLSTARSIAPEDLYIETEWAYLLFRKAIISPTVDAPELVKEATETLEDLMTTSSDPYLYHILGSQGLSWARRGITKVRERGRYLRKLTERIAEGCEKYPREGDLATLHQDLKREYMGLAVSNP